MHDETPSLPLFDVIGDTGIVLPAKYRPSAAQWPRGQSGKISAAVSALRTADQLPAWLTFAEIRRRTDAWLRSQGLFAHELPSRSAYYRYLADALTETTRDE
jgi:hypothetical protein